MDETGSLKHRRWECKYHVVFILEYRRKALHIKLRKYWGEVFRQLAQCQESQILEGHLMSDHVHMLIVIASKYAVSQVVGHIKGKSAIHIARELGGHQHNFCWGALLGERFFVSTVGRNEERGRVSVPAKPF
jgi:putative transposase